MFSVLAYGLAAFSAPLQAEMLSVVINENRTIQSGDKTFSDFLYSATGDMPGAEDINVVPTVDSHGNFGITFQGGFLDFPGGGTSDALIEYKVTAGAGRLISDAHLAANLDVTGGPGLLEGFISITETFLPAASDLVLTVFDLEPDGEQLLDWGDFAVPMQMLNVQKNIIAFSANSFTVPTMSFVDQTFSQIPEPTACVLGVLGFVGMALVHRRQRDG